jgi:VCBS repeat-containing protein
MDSQAAQSMSASTTMTTGKRSARRRRQPYAWLGASALTLGVGVALAGAGVAHADDAASAGSASSVNASPAAVNSQKAPQAAVRNRGAAVRTVGEGAVTDRTANTRVVVAGTSGRSAVLATVSRKAAATTVGSPAKAVVAPTTVPPVSQPPYFGGFRLPPSPTQGAPRFEGTFGPGAPKPADFGVFAPLAWAVAEVAYQVQGLAPLAKPNQLPSLPGQAEVVGTLNTVAAYGAPVTFAVTTKPAYGTVAVNPQGIYTYTPNAELAASGGTDSFVVTATDGRIHLENFLGLPGRATTMTVPVTVAAPAEAAPVGGVEGARQSNQLASSTAAATRPYQVTFNVHNASWATQVFGSTATGYGTTPGQPGTIVSVPGDGFQLQTAQSTSYVLSFNDQKQDIFIQYIESRSGTDGAPPLPSDAPAGTFSWWPDSENKEFSISNLFKTVATECTPKKGACSTPAYGVKGGDIYFLDAPGTVYTVPADQAQRQTDILQSLVASDLSNATYFPKSQATVGYTDPLKVQGFSPYTNNTRRDSTNTYTVSQTTTKTDSYTHQVSVNVNEEAKLGLLTVKAQQGITNTYGTQTADSQTYTQSTTQTVEPGETLFLYTETPVQRFYGDWHVVYGNTTYIMNDVWFDSPYPVSGTYPSFLTAFTCTAGSSDCAQLAAGVIPDNGDYAESWPYGPNYPVAETPASSTTASRQRSATV